MPIPPELQESLREVFDRIQEAKSDPDVSLDYGDAIQVGAVCGGRIGKKPRPYVLTYYPAGDAERGRWFLKLHRTEIEDIGDGRITEITLYCCTSPGCRSKFREADDHCFYCDYINDPNYGNFFFPEAVSRLADRGIVGVAESTSKEAVIAMLGQPDESGGGTDSKYGYIWPWIKFRRANCAVHFEFSKSETRIRCISIQEADWRPGK